MSFVKHGDAQPILHTIKPESIEEEKKEQAKEVFKDDDNKIKKLPPQIPGNKIESN